MKCTQHRPTYQSVAPLLRLKLARFASEPRRIQTAESRGLPVAVNRYISTSLVDHVAARHISCQNRRADPVCSASVVRHVLGWAADHACLDSLLRRAKRLGYCSNDVPVVTDLFDSADDDFFHRVKTNSNHVLQPYLPDKADISYQLRTRCHPAVTI